MKSESIYLDYNATTPCDQRVIDGMLPFFNTHFGNAASHHHSFGFYAEEAVEHARNNIAKLVGSKPGEIIFTSGATESINLVLRGLQNYASKKGKHIITWATEHKAVLETLSWLENQGYEVTVLPVDQQGQPDLETLKVSIRRDTILVVMMMANNETGVMMPVREVVKLVHPYEILTLCDATQAVGKVPMDLKSLGADFVAFSAHKFYGPKGAGALYIAGGSNKTNLEPLLTGGGHEANIRSGTVNVPGIVGMGLAAEIAITSLSEDVKRIGGLRDHFVSELIKTGVVEPNFGSSTLLPNTANLRFNFQGSDLLLQKISSKVAASSGSACSSVVQKPSHVLKAMGLTDQQALSSIRFSLGKFTTKSELDRAVEIITEKINSIKN
ncbi:MAG: cysteine desulfurase [Bacteroidetes bacterium]|nr:cysteine desulfurase [Bacteroidota bacterium]